MAIVVLVHGSFVGGWSWNRLAPFLREAGHAVYAPSLTGLGARAHLAHAGINLDTHIADVVNVLFYEDLTDVTLVGWSYGGMVITGVAERVPERLRQLVYLDAPVPEDGQSLYDADGYSEEERAEEWAKGEAAGLPGFEPSPTEEWIRANLPPEADPEWIAARVTPQPLATLSQPVRIQNPAALALPRAFVLCTADKEWEDIPFFRFVDRIRADPAWRYREAAVEHLGPLTTPEPVAEALLSLIDG
jgi:pimeloyl-ACP methyl ester carboxylesterase